MGIFCTEIPCGVMWWIWPGVVTFTRSLVCTSILYPGGRKVLKPIMRSGWPLNSWDTRLITPGVSILQGKQEKKIFIKYFEKQKLTKIFSIKFYL